MRELLCLSWIYPTVVFDSCDKVAQIMNNRQLLDDEYLLKAGEVEFKVSKINYQ